MGYCTYHHRNAPRGSPDCSLCTMWVIYAICCIILGIIGLFFSLWLSAVAVIGYVHAATGYDRISSQKPSTTDKRTSIRLAAAKKKLHDPSALYLTAPLHYTGRDLSIQSHSNDRRSYKVSLKNMTCSCPDFRKSRASFPKRDPRRACKHIVEGLDQCGLLDKEGHLTRALLGNKNPELGLATLSAGYQVILTHNDRGWTDIYSPTRRCKELAENPTGPYEWFGFSSGWQDQRPPNAREVRQVIAAFLDGKEDR